MKAFLIWAVGYVIKKWLFRFPSDWGNSDQVRLFILSHGDTMRTLALQTETNVDDKLVEYVLTLASNKAAWDLAFGMILKATDNGKETIPVPDGNKDIVRPLRALLDRMRNRLSGE